jgi:hypothetical protein
MRLELLYFGKDYLTAVIVYFCEKRECIGFKRDLFPLIKRTVIRYDVVGVNICKRLIADELNSALNRNFFERVAEIESFFFDSCKVFRKNYFLDAAFRKSALA